MAKGLGIYRNSIMFLILLFLSSCNEKEVKVKYENFHFDSFKIYEVPVRKKIHYRLPENFKKVYNDSLLQTLPFGGMKTRPAVHFELYKNKFNNSGIIVEYFFEEGESESIKKFLKRNNIPSEERKLIAESEKDQYFIILKHGAKVKDVVFKDVFYVNKWYPNQLVLIKVCLVDGKEVSKEDVIKIAKSIEIINMGF